MSDVPQVSTFPPGLFNISINENRLSFLCPVNQPAIKSQGRPITILYHYFSYYLRCSPVFHLCRVKTKIWEGNWMQRAGNSLCSRTIQADPSWADCGSEWFFVFVFHFMAHDGVHRLQGRWHETILGGLQLRVGSRKPGKLSVWSYSTGLQLQRLSPKD